MPSPLPERPDLDQLRHQAKDLLRAARDAHPNALERIGAHLTLRPGVAVTLSAAQLIIAREYGFASWPALVAETRLRNASLVQQLTELVTRSLQDHFNPGADTASWIQHAKRLMAEQPDVAGLDIRIAAVLGEATHVHAMLARDPGLATRPDQAAGWPPLLFACSSRWHRIDPARAAGLVEVARLLLEAGADPNTAVEASPHRGHCSPLYAAAGLANHPALARLLLEHGADPDTPSALYHTAFHRDHACLRLLLHRGARAEGTHALGAAISVADTEAVRLLLEAGIDPRQPIPADAFGQTDEPAVPALLAAIRYRCQADMIDLLLAHGAGSSDRDGSGITPFQLATRHGDTAAIATLRRHGAPDDTGTLDRFLGACARAERTTAHAMLAEEPQLVAGLSTQDHAILADAAEHLGIAPVALMLELGFPATGRRESDGATAMHVAAHAGRAEVVRLLIEHGGDVNARDTEFDATPLSWASVGSGGSPGQHPDRDWIATIQILLDAGAATDGAWISAKPPSDEVAQLLLGLGVAPDDDPTSRSDPD